ncbi:MAG TPA: hypothetical protein PKY05_02005 [Fibrobacteria bacterium]|nr:hypothetical protein [Fibrobacteria bacterium]
MERESSPLPLEGRSRRALVCALDWGLGHVARSSVLVRRLLAGGTSVVLASNGRSADWWHGEFPDLPLRELPDYGVRYAPGPWLVPGLLASLPRLWRAMRRERALVESWKGEGFDLVVSDNRYGCRMTGVESVLLTHQLRLASPRGLGAFEGLGEWAVSRLVRGYDAVWIPDHPGVDGLSGRLGHPRRPAKFPPLRYLGPLSRMAGDCGDPRWSGPWDLVVLVSGPEPGRTNLESIVRRSLERAPGRHLLVRGRPDLPCPTVDPVAQGVAEVAHLPTPALVSALGGARRILSRGGYSTLMDLEALGILDGRCIWCPTPGQTEQETLASGLAAAGKGVVVPERSLEPFLRRVSFNG